MPSLLVIDDEPNVLYSLQTSLRTETLEVLTADTGKQGIKLTERHRPDVVLLDVRLGDMNGLEVFDQLRAINPRLPIILITAYTTTETAIEAMKRGAFDYLLKPVDFHKLQLLVNQALASGRSEEGKSEIEVEKAGEPGGTDPIVGRSPQMQEVYKAIGRIAQQNVTVLILGESGTGKELVARSLYEHSTRVDEPFLTINCAAIAEGLLESELFGHEKGAFTGADRRRVGKFEQAHRGTLFLDEIGDMSPATQAKVLRLLQEQRFERVGGNETIQADVRVIAATNQDLTTAVAEGRFRQDLFYRLNGFTIHLPALRERREDIPLLVEHFVRMFQQTTGSRVRAVSSETMRLLTAHSWPGNVRELQNTIRYALIHSTGDVLGVDALPEAIHHHVGGSVPQAREEFGAFDLQRLVEEMLATGEMDIYRRAMLEADRVILESVLRHVRGNQVQASELLGISRTTLRARMRALGMVLEKQVQTEGMRSREGRAAHWVD